MKTYVTKFQWEGAKYPLKQSLKLLTEIMGKVGYLSLLNFKCLFQQVTQIDNDLKSKSITYNNLKNNLNQIDRKATYVYGFFSEMLIFSGSLVTKDLADVVKAEDFVLNSEYLQTLMVVVPK